MIFKGSRYEKVGTYQVIDGAGRTVTALSMRGVPPTPAGYVHTFTQDQRLDILAYNFYGNPEKFWLICDANRPMDPEDLLEPGRRLLIPPDRSS